MSFEAIKWAWECEVQNVHQRAVLLCLADYQNKHTKLCCPGIDSIAEKVCCNVKTVRKVLPELEQLGHIEIVERAGNSKLYLLRTPTTAGTPATDGTPTTCGTPTPTTAGTPPLPPVVPEPVNNQEYNPINNNKWPINENWMPEDDIVTLARQTVMCSDEELEQVINEFKVFVKYDDKDKYGSPQAAFKNMFHKILIRVRHRKAEVAKGEKRRQFVATTGEVDTSSDFITPEFLDELREQYGDQVS